MFSSETKHSINLLWPDRVILEDPIPEFLPEGRYIFYSDSTNFSRDQDYIIVKKTTEIGVNLSSKDQFFEVLLSIRKIKISDKKKEQVLGLRDSEFWRVMKIMSVTKKVPELRKEGIPIYQFYEQLHKGLHITFPLYVQSGEHHMSILTSLVTFFGACSLSRDELEKQYSTWFSSTVLNNRIYLPLFRKNMIRFLLSEQKEADFLLFLLDMRPR